MKETLKELVQQLIDLKKEKKDTVKNFNDLIASVQSQIEKEVKE